MHVAHRAAADPSASQRSDHLKKRVDETVIELMLVYFHTLR